MIGVYFSGTGNTKHCVEAFVKRFECSNAVISMENPNVIDLLEKNEFIIFGYPIYFSNTPKIVKDFLVENKKCFKDKKIFIISTMGLFQEINVQCVIAVLANVQLRL